MSETIVRDYYRCFNERRIGDATELLAKDARWNTSCSDARITDSSAPPRG